MARSRNIKPGLFKNEILGIADPLYTLAFQGLWVLADREGRLEDRPLRIKAETFPYRETISMDALLDWLHANGFILRKIVVKIRDAHLLEETETGHCKPARETPGTARATPALVTAASNPNRAATR